MVTLWYGLLTVQCTVAEFQTIEPSYPSLPPGIITRQWTPELSFLSNGWIQQPNTLDCRAYCLKISEYQQRLGHANRGVLAP